MIDTDKILKSIPIPSRPSVLIDLMAESRKEEPDLRRMARLIAGDIGLFAALLKTVNSPFFGLRSKVSTVPDAIGLLGMKNVMNLVTSIALRNAVGNAPPSVERFWSITEMVALIAAHVASSIPGVSRDEAYSYALFHDCGIPVLEQKLPGYSATVAIANVACRDGVQSFTAIENEHHHTSHTSLGYLLTKSWGLPEELCTAVQLHHDPAVYSMSGISPKALSLISVGLLAENIHSTLYHFQNDGEWAFMGQSALEYLALTPIEYEEIKDGAEQKFAA